MRRVKKGMWTAVLMIFMGGHLSLAEAALAPYKIRHLDGAEVDWLAGKASAIGNVRVIYNIKTKRGYQRQVRANAKTAARDMLLSALTEVAVGDERRVADIPEVLSEMQKVLDAATGTEIKTGRTIRMLVSLEAPLWGTHGLVGLVMMSDQPPEEDRDPAMVADASTGPEQTRNGTARAEHAASEDSDTAVSGLVIDATDVPDALPALFARIVDENGDLVYGLEVADPQFARDWGMISYALPAKPGGGIRRSWKREGENPIRIRAVGATGAGNTDLVVSAADAGRIRAAAGESPFLKQCRVLALMSPPVQQAPPAK